MKNILPEYCNGSHTISSCTSIFKRVLINFSKLVVPLHRSHIIIDFTSGGDFLPQDEDCIHKTCTGIVHLMIQSTNTTTIAPTWQIQELSYIPFSPKLNLNRPLSHRDSMVSDVYYEVHMTRVGARNLKVWGSVPHGESEFFLCPTLVTRRKTSFFISLTSSELTSS